MAIRSDHQRSGCTPRIRWRAIVAIAACSAAVAPSHAAVSLELRGDEVLVSISQKPFAVFDASADHHRPYFREIRAPDGTVLSRPISPPGGDHPHHTGIWIAVDKVGGIDFWHEQGRIKNLLVDVVQTGANPATMRVRNDWIAPDGQVVLQEQTTIHVYESRLLAYDIRLTAGGKDVTFGDTEEGFFACRMADSMCEEQTGRVCNADGLTTAKGCWGQTSDWVDYYGQVGGKTFGVAIFDYPLNFRRSRYHVRDYGLFTINPFGDRDYTRGERPAAPMTIPAGQTLRLRYGVFFHDGDTASGKVIDTCRDFVAQTAEREIESNRLREILYRSTADGTIQPAMFYAPAAPEPVPLLVALHTWSGDYRQDYHRECAAWCVKKGWAYIHPNFRGPNRRPEATGSDEAVQDVVDAVTFATRHANVDLARIYLVGTSGGGYMALLMAGRHPEIWAGVSAWVPVADLAAWYDENKAMGGKYWREVATSCGGPPGTSDEVDRQYRRRSPITYLDDNNSVALDINAGIRDGHDGSVPVSHALRAFNKLADEQDRFTKEEIDYFVGEAKAPPHLQQKISDHTYGNKPPLYRRYAERARVTLFDGGHELIPQAALHWLEQQRLDKPTTRSE